MGDNLPHCWCIGCTPWHRTEDWPWNLSHSGHQSPYHQSGKWARCERGVSPGIPHVRPTWLGCRNSLLFSEQVWGVYTLAQEGSSYIWGFFNQTIILMDFLEEILTTNVKGMSNTICKLFFWARIALSKCMSRFQSFEDDIIFKINVHTAMVGCGGNQVSNPLETGSKLWTWYFTTETWAWHRFWAILCKYTYKG